jgi:hypothetical protein
MRGRDASEAQCAQCAHVAMHFTRRLLCCHELLSVRILVDNNSATILLHTRLDHSFVCMCVVYDTTVSTRTRTYTTLQCLEVHVRTCTRVLKALN